VAKSAAKRRKNQKRKAREKTQRRESRKQGRSEAQPGFAPSRPMSETITHQSSADSLADTSPVASTLTAQQVVPPRSSWSPSSINGKIWKEVLEAAYSHSKGSHNRGLREWLIDLVPAAQSQKRSYESSRVKIDYSQPDAQAAYLLRSFVPYTHFIQLALAQVVRKHPPADLLRHCDHLYLLGGGPAPEALGLMSWLFKGAHHNVPHNLDITVVDQYARSWDWWRTRLNSSVINSIFGRRFTGMITSKKYDFELQQSIFSQTNFAAQRSPLIMAQNLANELSTKAHDCLIDELVQVLRRHRNTHLLVVDPVDGYPNIPRFYNGLDGAMTKLGACVIRRKLTNYIEHNRPPILLETLHHGDYKVRPIANLSNMKFEFLYATYSGVS
jgi:hypothetical protein